MTEHPNLEYSCGAVIFRDSPEGHQYLLVCNKNGIYGFPKGHMELGETEIETAHREVQEETGLSIRITTGFRAVDDYQLPNSPNRKQVVYFIGEITGGDLRFQETELSGGVWATYEQAIGLLQFERSRAILTEAQGFLRKSP